MMKCFACAAECDERSRYCGQCGQALIDALTGYSLAPRPDKEAFADTRLPRSSLALATVAALSFSVSGVAATKVMHQHRSSEGQQPSATENSRLPAVAVGLPIPVGAPLSKAETHAALASRSSTAATGLSPSSPEHKARPHVRRTDVRLASNDWAEESLATELYASRVRYVIQRYYAPRMATCFADASSSAGTEDADRVVVGLAIGSEGQVARVWSRGAHSDGSRGCILSHAGGWRLPPPPTTGSVEMEVPLARVERN